MAPYEYLRFSADPPGVGANRIVYDYSCGAVHCCAVLDNSDVACWGSNARGELGLPLSVPRVGGAGSTTLANGILQLPFGTQVNAVSAGYEHSCIR